MPTFDFIDLPPVNTFASIYTYYAVALHELGHWPGTRSRISSACAKSAVRHNSRMRTKSGQQTRRMALSPVATFKDIPVLSQQERNDLIDSLEVPAAQFDAGDFVECEPAAFDGRLLDIDRNARRAQNV